MTPIDFGAEFLLSTIVLIAGKWKLYICVQVWSSGSIPVCHQNVLPISLCLMNLDPLQGELGCPLYKWSRNDWTLALRGSCKQTMDPYHARLSQLHEAKKLHEANRYWWYCRKALPNAAPWVWELPWCSPGKTDPDKVGIFFNLKARNGKHAETVLHSVFFSCLLTDAGDLEQTFLQKQHSQDGVTKTQYEDQYEDQKHIQQDIWTKNSSKPWRMAIVQRIDESILGRPRANLKPSKNRSIWIEIMKMWPSTIKKQLLYSSDCEFAVSKQSQLLFMTNCLMFCSHLTHLSMYSFMTQNRFRRHFVPHHFIFAEGCFFQTFFSHRSVTHHSFFWLWFCWRNQAFKTTKLHSKRFRLQRLPAWWAPTYNRNLSMGHSDAAFDVTRTHPVQVRDAVIPSTCIKTWILWWGQY